ncbi:MAG: exonuclease [Gemmataceae bacterium]|nr:exonuclease [Gemmataceae bacterium]
MPEIYVSTDVETDGPIPGPHSMLSFASAAYRADKTLIATFSANLQLLPGATGDVRTMAWWAQNQATFDATRVDLEEPMEAMRRYVAWVNALPDTPVFVAYPAGFDFLFVYWYLIRFVGESPFSFSALDMKTYAMALLKKEYRQSVKKNMPKAWFDDFPHTHVALDDAIEQGALFCNMLAANK